MFEKVYNMVMDPRQNPLRGLPKTVRFQYMLILSYMWSAIFTIWVGSAVAFGSSVVGHTVLLVGVFFTADVFRRARARAASHRDAMRNPRDNTVLYDDMWGAP